MSMEKLASLERSLGNSYSENLGIRLSGESPVFKEITGMSGRSDALKRMLRLN